jgi:sterol 3beta-glucosyltransferase
MKIALLTLGTRGDVQPYAVLGEVLKRRGHDVILSTGRNFRSLADAYGLNFIPVEADFHALINSPEGKAMMRNPFLARKHFRTTVEPMMVDAMTTFYSVAAGADCVLYHAKSLGDFFADQFPEKMVRANVVPALTPTSAFPNPVFSGLSLPKFLNRFTYKLADLGLAMMNPAIRKFRLASGLGLELPQRTNCMELYGISESFLNKPADFSDDIFFTGFWHGESSQNLDEELMRFISPERKTIVVTFGSMPFQTNFDLQKGLLEVSRTLDVKILVVKGWGFEDVPVSENKSMKVIEHAPFDKLFPAVAAVVHHGGIGTLSECLRGGVPSLSCPVIYPMGDQHFWGNHAYKSGYAVKPVPLKKLNLDRLTKSIFEMLTNKGIRENCQILSSKLASEKALRMRLQSLNLISFSREM